MGTAKNSLRSKFSLRFKMILALLTILLAVTGSMAWLSSQPFIDQNKNLIFELNSTASVKMASALADFFKSNSGRLGASGKTLFNQSSLAPDSDFLFVGLYSQSSEDDFREEKSLATSQLPGVLEAKSLTAWKTSLERAAQGVPQVFPVKFSKVGWTLAQAVPYLSENQEVTGRVLLGAFKPDRLSDLLGESEPSRVLLVNSTGVLLGASADCPFEVGTALASRPTIQAFINRNFSNGQSRLDDPQTGKPLLSSFRTVGYNDLGIITEVPEAAAFKALQRVQYRTVLVAVLIFCIAFVFGHFQSGSITEPIAVLALAADEIAQGNFNVSVKVKATNELGLLASAFERMKNELRAREQALVAQEKLATAGRIARNIGHEFGNLLQPLIIKLDLLETSFDKEGNEEKSKAVQEILQIAMLGSEICRGLMTLARERPDAANFARVPLAGTVRKAVGLLSHELKARDIVPTIEVTDGLAVLAVEPQILQVLINLIINALHAMSVGGKLTIRGEQRGEKIILEVRDSGTGIKPEHLPRIFDPLFSTKGAQGNGLGLGIAAGILKEHQGRIYAESIFGEGTTMTLEFPVPAESPALAA